MVIIVFTAPRDSTRDDLWQASIECSDDAITIQVQQTGDRSSIDTEFFREVLIQCTNGNDQVGRPNNNYNVYDDNLDWGRNRAREMYMHAFHPLHIMTCVFMQTEWKVLIKLSQIMTQPGNNNHYHVIIIILLLCSSIIQAEISVNCTIQEERMYTRTISDLSTLGIESGWTCSFSGCFEVHFNNARSYYRTPTDSCTLPMGEQP